jgi:hypothetical protein
MGGMRRSAQSFAVQSIGLWALTANVSPSLVLLLQQGQASLSHWQQARTHVMKLWFFLSHAATMD